MQVFMISAVSEPIDLSATWPSSYADGGQVSWSKAESDPDGNLKVSFPEIRLANSLYEETFSGIDLHAAGKTSGRLKGGLRYNTTPFCVVQ